MPIQSMAGTTITSAWGPGRKTTTCTTGWKIRDKRGDRPIARPTGRAHNVPHASRQESRTSVANAASMIASQCLSEGLRKKAEQLPCPPESTSKSNRNMNDENREIHGDVFRDPGRPGRQQGSLERCGKPLSKPAHETAARGDKAGARSRSSNHEDAASSLTALLDPELLRQTTTGRHRSWSKPTIIRTMASMAQSIESARPHRRRRSCRSRAPAGGNRCRPAGRLR